VEGAMYTYAKQNGISLMTVSHRPSLWKYHDFLLEFDGSGNYKFVPINEVKNQATNQNISIMTLEQEKVTLEKRIIEDNQRVKKIKTLLGTDL